MDDGFVMRHHIRVNKETCNCWVRLGEVGKGIGA